MTALLVSVRSAAEALKGVEAGAAIIDVKEPAHGSLGRPEDATVAEILRVVAGRRPVSMALGELAEAASLPMQGGLRFLKWGLAGCTSESNWSQQLQHKASELHERQPDSSLVAVAYADACRAQAPPVAEVAGWACSRPGSVLLIDTWKKDGTHLLHWLSLPALEELINQCRTAKVRIALAGSLAPRQIEVLQPLRPDWFAVRGAVCEQGVRNASLCPVRIRALVRQLASTAAD